MTANLAARSTAIAMLTRRQLLLGLMLAALGAAAWWLLESKTQDEAPPLVKQRHPDYIIDIFSATTMTDTGTPDRRLIATQLRHFADDDSHELDNPNLVLFTEDGPPWRIRAEYGWMSGDKTRIKLHTNVSIDRSADHSGRAVHLETEALDLYPKRDYAETQRPVKLASEQDWLTSTGMQAWLTDQFRARFEGRAHMLFRPH